MSLTPYILHDYITDRPTRLLDQHFGLNMIPEDLLEPLTLPSWRSAHNYYRPWRSALAKLDQGSTMFANKDKFQMTLDVQQFAPNEINVKISDDNSITIEGKHEEKQDEHGYISRQFTRRYVLPPGHDIKKVTSSLSSDGVLTISAPRIVTDGSSSERTITITHTGPVKKTNAIEEQK